MTTIRNILDKLIYNDESVNIDENLRDSNVGARKNRNIRNRSTILHIFSWTNIASWARLGGKGQCLEYVFC